MPNNPVLHLLGLARKAGKIELGEEPVGAACRSRHAKLLLLASDTAANTRRRAAHFGEAGNVLWLECPFTKEELGLLFGRSSCAMLALTDAGFSASIVEKLTALDPEKYGPAALRLREKADRVYQRQKEQRRHEKKLQQGKQPPWAAPAKQAGKHPGAKPSGASCAPPAHLNRPARAKPPAAVGEATRSGKSDTAKPFTRGGTTPSFGKPARGKPFPRAGAPARPGGKPSGPRPFAKGAPSANPSKAAHPKPLTQGASAPRAMDGSARSGRTSKPGPGQRRLTGKFRHNP